MLVAVTGGSGKIGQAALAALRQAGHRAVNFDLRPGALGRFVRLDVTDFGEVLGAFSGVDAVAGRPDAILHLAGIPAPGLTSDAEVFRVNSLATYNVFSAAARLGIARVVWASSETILGLPFDQPPAFAPIDETHPDRPEWSYALAKQMGEAAADSFVRWTPGLSIASLRFSNVYVREDYAALPRIQADPAQRRWNLWSYVDARDAGQACRLALEADFTGHERMIIAAADTLMETPSAELMAAHFPGTPLRGDVAGDQALLSSSYAGECIGYAPRWSWRDLD